MITAASVGKGDERRCEMSMERTPLLVRVLELLYAEDLYTELFVPGHRRWASAAATRRRGLIMVATLLVPIC